MNEHTWDNLDTWERRDHELIRENLNEAPVRFEERELKAGMNNIWKDGLRSKEMETTHEMLRIGEKNTHNQKNYERMAAS